MHPERQKKKKKIGETQGRIFVYICDDYKTGNVKEEIGAQMETKTALINSSDSTRLLSKEKGSWQGFFQKKKCSGT